MKCCNAETMCIILYNMQSLHNMCTLDHRTSGVHIRHTTSIQVATTVNDEILAGLKFGESKLICQTLFAKK